MNINPPETVVADTPRLPIPQTFLSLFDGCHMFGLALRRAGFECVGTSEIDKHACAVTRHQYPDTLQLGDVAHVQPAQPFSLLVGGFPCQDLSVAGSRCGLSGERSGLFWEIVRIARESSPRWLLLENVPGLLSSNKRRDMGAVVGALVELGYGVAWRVLDAQYLGVPQRRRRVFIVGCLGDVRGAGQVLFEPESCCGNPASLRAPWSEAARAAGVGFDRDRSAADRRGSDGGDRGARYLTHHSGRYDGDTETCISVGGNISHTLTGEGHDASEDGSGRGTPIVAHMPRSVSLRGRDGGIAAEMGGTVASALRASQGGGDKAFVSYQSRVRRLMPVECERLQGLPDDWTRYGRREDGTVYELSNAARYRMIGNGGAVPVVEWIARRISAKQETHER